MFYFFHEILSIKNEENVDNYSFHHIWKSVTILLYKNNEVMKFGNKESNNLT
jgi:hypothetical protein